MIAVVCFKNSCNIFVSFTRGCAGTTAVVGFKFVANIAAKRSKARMISPPNYNVIEDSVGCLIA